MKCGDVCPTEAIQPVERNVTSILGNVKMGHAVVDESLCLSYQGKPCGVLLGISHFWVLDLRKSRKSNIAIFTEFRGPRGTLSTQ